MQKPKTKITSATVKAVLRAPQNAAKQQVLDMAEDILGRYIAGESFDAIAASLKLDVPSWRVRSILLNNPETYDLYNEAEVLRAHHLAETAINYGREAAMLGDASGLRVAIDVNLKVASKLHPTKYGDSKKVELTGAGGGPIKMVALTDEQLMEIASRGAQESGS